MKVSVGTILISNFLTKARSRASSSGSFGTTWVFSTVVMSISGRNGLVKFPDWGGCQPESQVYAIRSAPERGDSSPLSIEDIVKSKRKLKVISVEKKKDSGGQGI